MYGAAYAQQKAVEPVGECWDEKKMLIELAARLGLKDFWKSTREALDDRLEFTGMTFDQLIEKGGRTRSPFSYRQYEKDGSFNTPTGKFEFYSESFEKLGLDPIPAHHEPPESPVSTPGLASEYPFVLTTGARDVAYYHSALRNIASLRKLSPEPTVEINPKTAGSLDIEEGDWVLVETRRGSITRRAKLFDGIHPQVIHVSHGWWYDYEPEWKQVNVNILTDNENLDSILGSEPLKGALCRVRPATP
jgi:anaerobic selenocysteine-containing dehydrogenase